MKSARIVALAAIAVFLAALAVLAPHRSASADDPLATKEMEVERQLGCPICTNLPLNVCDNQICEQMKGIIHQKLTDGATPDEVVAFFVGHYGEGILLTPPQEGFNLAVWYLPVAALVLGALLVWAFVRQSVERQRVANRRLATAETGLEVYRQQVRHELRDGDPDAVEAAP